MEVKEFILDLAEKEVAELSQEQITDLEAVIIEQIVVEIESRISLKFKRGFG